MPETLALSDIQKLQFSDKKRAEKAVLPLMPERDGVRASEVQLLPKPESLNSVNGYVTYPDGARYFFKAHTEENEKVSEYYNASLLRDAGYPVVSAKRIAHQPGQQFVLYEILTFATLFDVVKAEEDRSAGIRSAAVSAASGSEPAERILDAQIDLDRTVFEIYRKTLRTVSAEEDARAPIHQLFHHRLQDDGRYGLFYKGRSLQLENGTISFAELGKLKWTVNGVHCAQTLEELIDVSRDALRPTGGAAVIGHGDAHNGNVFVDNNERLLFFDPAFAGVHSPLLDMVKPMFHNVFARWMYYPEQVSGEFELSYKIEGDRMIVNHSYQPSALRLAFLASRQHNLLDPTVALLKEKELLLQNWEQVIRSALFCCPFLTVNLFAPYVANGTLAERYPLAVKLLGLAMAVWLGSERE
jgi:hypothetical protein